MQWNRFVRKAAKCHDSGVVVLIREGDLKPTMEFRHAGSKHIPTAVLVGTEWLKTNLPDDIWTEFIATKLLQR